jgi:hypothetical protein
MEKKILRRRLKAKKFLRCFVGGKMIRVHISPASLARERFFIIQSL